MLLRQACDGAGAAHLLDGLAQLVELLQAEGSKVDPAGLGHCGRGEELRSSGAQLLQTNSGAPQRQGVRSVAAKFGART